MPVLTVWAVYAPQSVCVCPRHFERFPDSNYSDCMKKMPKYKNKIIFDSDLKALGVDFEARPLTSKFKIF